MSVLREIIEVSRELESSFDAVADFSNAVMWDPGVIAAEQTREGEASPSGVGAEYQLTVTFRGRESVMTYRTMEYRRPSRVVLEGIGPRIAARDTIEFESMQGGGTHLTYVADLRLTGLAKLAEPFLGGAFDAMGKRAVAGLKAWLSDTPERPAP